jgi:NAD(P)-dependent dehydrogenase (short-subunit alcohol dehydrogenase family)
MAERVFGGRDAATQAGASLQPIGRVGMPIDMARGALFLAADDSSFVTGQVLTVDGGYVAQ